MQTAERSSSYDPSENVIYNRCLFAYHAAANSVHSKIVELGSGEGYGIKFLANKATEYLALDKFDTEIPSGSSNVTFQKALFPSLSGIADNSFDFAVSFQVIEHIENDRMFVSEIYRVLKPGGKFLCSTPNRLMSLTRNPWHVREYTADELKNLLLSKFSNVEMNGVFGSQTVMDYHNKNKESVRRYTRFDIFNLQYHLPRRLLQIPYDILNRLNRRKLQKGNTDLVVNVTLADYSINKFSDQAFDLFAVAEK